jgi:hypothetical protein
MVTSFLEPFQLDHQHVDHHLRQELCAHLSNPIELRARPSEDDEQRRCRRRRKTSTRCARQQDKRQQHRRQRNNYAVARYPAALNRTDAAKAEAVEQQHLPESADGANTERREAGGITIALAGGLLTRGSAAPHPADPKQATRLLGHRMKELREEPMVHTGDPLTRESVAPLPVGPKHAMRQLGARKIRR